MKIISVEFKNIASYGNKKQKLEFPEDTTELYLTLGKNGHGKTTIANAIVFGLYGKVEGVKLGDLPNRINKELWVKVHVKCGTMDVVIERGLAPSFFKVVINGVEYDKAGKKSVQDYLEDEVFGIPYHVFKNIIILSINDFKSFLTMTPADKKQIIDRMFGFSVLNDMQRTVKEDRKALQSEIQSFNSELTQINESVLQVQMQINRLQAESAEKNKDEIQSLKDRLIKFSENKTKLEEANNTFIERLGSFEEDLSVKNSSYSKMKYELEAMQRKLALYDKNACPTCEAPLDSDFHTHKKQEYQDVVNSIPSKMETIEAEVSAIKTSITAARTKQSAIRDKVSTLNANIKSIKNELVKIKNSAGSADEFKHLKSLIDQFQDQEDERLSDKSSVENNYHFLETLEAILGEDGVKNMAVKTILPGLNANIAAMVNTMHLPFHIRFDEKFNSVINHLGEEINPMTLSTGERKSADFIVIIAIIKILKLRFPQLNLLFLDELLSSVDTDGVYNILKILSQVIKENNINTFVINHTVLPHEIFDKKISIYKDNGFSKFEIETIE
mgnify:CR=1 FL=1|tara:strand:- start:1456 stop:3129 length:1674 start_codon:yes stop_codon:yes gene_type:complete